MPRSFPSQPTRLLGRTEELETVDRLVIAHAVRLLTLTGPPGVGKSRLALEAGPYLADHFDGEVTLADFTAVRDTSRVLPAIAQALGVQERTDRPLPNHVEEYVGDRNVLLILDNFDQAAAAASQLTDLLGHCPGLKLLVTSRASLRLRWEHTLRIAPLDVPDLHYLPPTAALARIPSIALFLERAQAINPAFVLNDEIAHAVAELCVDLDGLPLAIELAAAHTNVLSPDMIRERLIRDPSLLTWEAPDLPERHQSLESAIRWSYDLLSENEQTLFRRLAVFVRGFDLESVEALASTSATPSPDILDGLGSLIDRSLIQVQEHLGERARYSMLESIRQCAWQRLEHHGEHDAVGFSSAHYFVKLAEKADHQLRKPDQRDWYLWLELEHDNLRAALRWLLDHQEAEMALQMAGALGFFWWTRGYGAEGGRWLEEALLRASSDASLFRIRACLRAGLLLMSERDAHRSRDVLEEALSLARKLQDQPSIAQSLICLGACATLAGERSESARLLQEAGHRWEDLGDPFYGGLSQFFQGTACFLQGEYTGAASLYGEAITRFDSLGDRRTAASMRSYLAIVHVQLGDIGSSMQLVREGIRASMTLRDRWQLTLAVSAALVVLRDHVDPEQHARLSGACDALRLAAGSRLGVWEQLAGQNHDGPRQRLEQEVWDAAYRQGRSLSFDEIVALALELPGDLSQTVSSPETTKGKQPEESPLSEREMEVLGLVTDGLSSKAIGKQLFISASTVNYHLTSIFNKLGVDTRAQAVATAVQRGLL